MLYLESSLNEATIRFLSEDNIIINLINKINKNELRIKYNLTSTFEIYNKIFNTDNKENIYKIFLDKKIIANPKKIDFKKEEFLPGMREHYMNFKQLAEAKGLTKEDAIYSISEEGDAYFYDIIEPKTMNKIFGRKIKGGKTKDDIINLNTLVFRDNFGYPFKVKNYKDLIQEMKLNRLPMSCLFNEYDEIDETLTSGITYFKLYYNKAVNEDILIISDKSGNYKEREQKPLFIITLDTSGSMDSFLKYIRKNKLFQKLLKKLGYSQLEGISPKLSELIEKEGIKNIELLGAMSSRIRLDNFLNRLNLKLIKDPDLSELIEKKGIQNIDLLEALSSDIRLDNFLNNYKLEEEYLLLKIDNELSEELIQKGIHIIKLLSAMRSNNRLNDFLENHNLEEEEIKKLKKKLYPEIEKLKEKFQEEINELKKNYKEIEKLKKFYEEIIIFIPFSDIAELYFLNISDLENYFKNYKLRWKGTYFKEASDKLKDILSTVSKKRSIRLLTFSDGVIKDSSECMKKLDQMLNSTKLRHQMKSVTVRVSNDSVPDTKVLMKLSSFSYPMSDMTQITIDPNKEKNIDKVVDKIYNQFKNDGMQYNLKLYSSIGLSDDFSKKFTQNEFSANKNLVLRVNGHRNHSLYKYLLKMSSGKIVVEDCGELKEHE